MLACHGWRAELGLRRGARCGEQKLRSAETVNLSVPPPSRVGLDMATTLERIQQSFVIADPTLPDCPLVFASDTFIDFTGCGPPRRLLHDARRPRRGASSR